MRRIPCLVLATLVVVAVAVGAEEPAPKDGAWFFAVAGDSRDCGDLIMPKIAYDIAANQAKTPVAFFWHLGDFRLAYDVDCDQLLRSHPSYDCASRTQPLGDDDMDAYLAGAWRDFLDRQIAPFGATRVFLGIGNHELAGGRTREDFRQTFRKWLTQGPIHAQRRADARRGIPSTEGDTSYHFTYRGADFIFLDNADPQAFTPEQITWLARVLAADAAEPTLRTIVVGMHEALPYSTVREHAMDATCQGRCSGSQVYDMLFRGQNLSAPEPQRKHVVVFASHMHTFASGVYDTPEHRGQVVPGWVIGTGGAQQYASPIRYGYVLVEVRPDGSAGVEFREVTRATPPPAAGPGAAALTDYCFAMNQSTSQRRQEPFRPCPCGSAP